MARAEITGRKARATAKASSEPPPIRGPPPLAFSIREFCQAHRISEAMYFKMQAAGSAPRTMTVGRRKLISIEAAAEWRRAREQAAEAAKSAAAAA
jgi:hypothetical protein